jgi:hypothetical protein
MTTLFNIYDLLFNTSIVTRGDSTSIIDRGGQYLYYRCRYNAYSIDCGANTSIIDRGDNIYIIDSRDKPTKRGSTKHK